MPTPDQIATVLDQLARGPKFVRQLIYEVPPELRKRRPAPGVWSAHEHAVHLPAIYPLVVRRLEQMLTEPSPHIKSYEPSRDDPDDALLKLDLDAEMDRFERERAALIERLRNSDASPVGDHRDARRILALRRVHHVPAHRPARSAPRVQDRRSVVAEGLDVGVRVGWVEFHETHQLQPKNLVGLVELDPPYIRFLRPRLRLKLFGKLVKLFVLRFVL